MFRWTWEWRIVSPSKESWLLVLLCFCLCLWRDLPYQCYTQQLTEDVQQQPGFVNDKILFQWWVLTKVLMTWYVMHKGYVLYEVVLRRVLYSNLVEGTKSSKAYGRAWGTQEHLKNWMRFIRVVMHSFWFYTRPVELCMWDHKKYIKINKIKKGDQWQKDGRKMMDR